MKAIRCSIIATTPPEISSHCTRTSNASLMISVHEEEKSVTKTNNRIAEWINYTEFL